MNKKREEDSQKGEASDDGEAAPWGEQTLTLISFVYLGKLIAFLSSINFNDHYSIWEMDIYKNFVILL